MNEENCGMAPDPCAEGGPSRYNLNFGQALDWMRFRRARVRRSGWNGVGMHVAYCPGYPEGIPANYNHARSHGIPEGTTVSIRPYLMMFTADGDYVAWVASQTDLLADDWQVVEEPVETMVVPPRFGKKAQQVARMMGSVGGLKPGR